MNDDQRGIADDRRAAIHALSRDGSHRFAEILTDRDDDPEDGLKKTMTDHERRKPSDVPGFGRVVGVDDLMPCAEYGDDPDTIDGAQEAPPFPKFAVRRAKLRQYSVERESLPDYDGDHIRIRDLRGTPDTSMVLSVVRAANAEGWRLADYHESGDELLFVPFEGGESQ